MQRTSSPRIWITCYIIVATILISLQGLWVPQHLKVSIHDERLQQLTYYNSPLYSKIYNHQFNGEFRLISKRHPIGMVAPSTFNIVSVRAWFDEETKNSNLIMNDRRYTISALETFKARRYHLLTPPELSVNIRLATSNQAFYSFDNASVHASTISRTHPNVVIFYLAVSALLFILIYAVWPRHHQYQGVLGATTASFITGALLTWLTTAYALPMMFLVIHVLPAVIILLVVSILLLIVSPHITIQLPRITLPTTHLTNYWDGYVLVLIHISIFVISMLYQPVISRGGNKYGFDGEIYFTMTEQLIANQTVTHVAPLVSRIGIPWFVAHVFTASPLVGWQIITTVSGLICTLMLYALSRQIISQPLIRIVVVTLFMTHWLAPLRYSWFHPVTLDSPLTALILVAVWTSIQYAKSWQPGWFIAFAINLLIGVTIREVPLLFIGFLILAEPHLIRHPIKTLAHPAVQRRLVAYIILAIVACGVYWSIQQSVVPTNNHSALAQAYRQLMYPPTYHTVLLAWFNTSGLLVVWLIMGYRSVWQFIQKYPQITYISISIIALAFISGTDKDRFLMWMHPFVLLMAAYAIEHTFKLFNTAWSVLIVYVQLIIGRAFWQTPDPGTASRVIDTTLFTHLGDNIFFLELWPHHAQDVYHKAIATQQFLWLLLILLVIFGLRAWRLRQTQLTHATESSH